MFTPVSNRPALVDEVRDRLVEAMADGRLPPGTPLRQEVLAADLGVSRQPVAQALTVLRELGLAVDLGRRGLQVAPLDVQGVRDIFDLRGALDALAARTLAERIEAGARTEADLDAARMTPPGPGAGFHLALIRLAGNAQATAAAERLWPHVRRALAAAGTAPAGAQEGHEDILAAIASGKARKAEKAARAHAEAAMARVCAAL
ncbi:GntR family transcriptional regulator [Futiania mangrovi]|uniref:GntR family transcriptional regulator n=1 Tax=Futiania mangrovi TaxID=2959716 RepID=A0A9J6PJX9_9PROT|nr:GntR family transcriptional regulator [Futiania mangrovii]MCP1336847.1 GntR family transcriptional regulator [Futiania mangrovii]